MPVDDKVIELALNSDFKDFEDAVQYYCAIENGIKVLITSNLKDFKHAKITVLTAEEFVKQNRLLQPRNRQALLSACLIWPVAHALIVY